MLTFPQRVKGHSCERVESCCPRHHSNSQRYWVTAPSYPPSLSFASQSGRRRQLSLRGCVPACTDCSTLLFCSAPAVDFQVCWLSHAGAWSGSSWLVRSKFDSGQLSSVWPRSTFRDGLFSPVYLLVLKHFCSPALHSHGICPSWRTSWWLCRKCFRYWWRSDECGSRRAASSLCNLFPWGLALLYSVSAWPIWLVNSRTSFWFGSTRGISYKIPSPHSPRCSRSMNSANQCRSFHWSSFRPFR